MQIQIEEDTRDNLDYRIQECERNAEAMATRRTTNAARCCRL